jgi:hypothetical protein
MNMNLKKALLPIAVLFVAIGCTSNAAPTVERVQNVLAPAVAKNVPGVTTQVVGIQEDPNGNAASAALEFSQYGRMVGRGKAKLVHYTDGRWVITDVESGVEGISMSGSLEVK